MQDSEVPFEPVDGSDDLTVEPDHDAGAHIEQLSLMDVQHEQLAVAERLATWRAFAAPLAANAGAVVEDPELVQLAVHILAIFADHQSRSGLSFAQLKEGLRHLGIRRPLAVIEARLEHLHRMGFLEPYLPKLHQGRYVVRPAGLAGALAAARVTERGGVDELILLLDRTRSALQLRNPDPVRILAHLNSCRHALMVFALDLQRRVASGTAAELIEAGRQHDHSSFTRQVAELNQLVTARFAGRYELEEAGTALIEAEQFYRSQVRSAIGKVLAQGGAGLNFDVLTPAEYETAALTASVDQLAEVGTSLIFDAPSTYVDPEALIEAIEQYQPRSRTRVRPPESVAPPDDPDPLAAVEVADEAARRHRRLGLEALLAGEREVDLTPHMQVSWDTAVQIVVDALALDADPREPFVLDLAEWLMVDSAAPVTYLHPARLIRTDLVIPESGFTSGDAEELGENRDR
ncbi:hypothetical protein [Amycolatopsis sp. NPDC051716]|uniref:hypothetical protein n=1 Tax=Amycolatopsis sp. NPDC051716 TaxID=3155804 RepID=UPI0034318957